METLRVNSMPTIGLVAQREALTERVRRVLEAGDLPIAFDMTPEALENGQKGPHVDVVVVVGSIVSRDDSPFGRIRDRLPKVRIVVCTGPVESSTMRWAIDKGADGLVSEPRLEDSLVATIRSVHAGQLVVPRELRRQLQPPDLTNREKQVLSLVLMGLTNREIAEKLFVSENTVKSHLHTAYRKLGVHSRAEAQWVIADPDKGVGTGILAITAPGLTRGRRPKTRENAS